jgi:Leucine-rich repeat (LRR) protein
MKNLMRLDLSLNNLVRLSGGIGKLVNLQILWLNDNPLRETPPELANCTKLVELDLRNTYIIELARELAQLKNLVYCNLNACPLKTSLAATYKTGITKLHSEFNRKNDRKIYKFKILNKLSEWVYPSVDPKFILEKLEVVFLHLKDIDTQKLKKLLRNCERIFPKLFFQIDGEAIRNKLLELEDESISREQISQIQIRLKAHFRDEPLADVVNLATDLFHNCPEDLLDEFFLYKKHVFLEKFSKLNAKILQENLEFYKKRKAEERKKAIRSLRKKIKLFYAEEKYEEEKIDDYTNQLVSLLKKTELILQFVKNYKAFIPKPTRQAFNAAEIISKFKAKTSENTDKSPFNPEATHNTLNLNP